MSLYPINDDQISELGEIMGQIEAVFGMADGQLGEGEKGIDLVKLEDISSRIQHLVDAIRKNEPIHYR